MPATVADLVLSVDPAAAIGVDSGATNPATPLVSATADCAGAGSVVLDSILWATGDAVRFDAANCVAETAGTALDAETAKAKPRLVCSCQTADVCRMPSRSTVLCVYTCEPLTAL